MGIYLPGAGTLGCVVWPQSGINYSPGILPDVYPPHVGPPVPLAAALPPLPRHGHKSSSPPWLPIKAPPTCLDEYDFFKSLVVRLPYSSIFWQFWVVFLFCFEVIVIFLIVVQGGKACLPSPPSLLEVKGFLFEEGGGGGGGGEEEGDREIGIKRNDIK